MAAPLKYNPQYHDDWAWSLAMKGADDEEIAKAFRISRRTVNRWKNSYPSFDEALQNGKEAADSKVEKSLYTRACGYETKEIEQIIETDEVTGAHSVKRQRIVTKQVPPDTMAIMYWLNNRSRRSGEWTQRQEVQLEASNGSETDVVIVLPSNKRQDHIDGTIEKAAED